MDSPTAPLIEAPAAPRVLVILPTLNERAHVRVVVEGVRAALPNADVLVVDDGSADGTPEIADALAHELGRIQVLRRGGPRGLGPAFRAGFSVGLLRGYDVLV